MLKLKEIQNHVEILKNVEFPSQQMGDLKSSILESFR